MQIKMPRADTAIGALLLCGGLLLALWAQQGSPAETPSLGQALLRPAQAARAAPLR